MEGEVKLRATVGPTRLTVCQGQGVVFWYAIEEEEEEEEEEVKRLPPRPI